MPGKTGMSYPRNCQPIPRGYFRGPSESPMGWFKHWFGTRYYSLLYGHRDEADAQDWVRAILGRWDLPQGAAILDLACGRGRHTRLFADQGFDVTGVDISGASIEEARRTVPNARFLEHDMRDPVGKETFDAACCLFTSLGYFDDREDDHRVFRAVFDGLRPGGAFVIDFMNTDKVLRGLIAHEVIVREQVEFNITRCLEDGVLVKRIDVKDDEEQHRFEERVQALTPLELEHMATAAGFEIEARTDGPVLTPFNSERAERFVLWLRKPRA